MPKFKPGAALAKLRQRAQVLAKIRSFMAAREVLEVTTPVLSTAAAVEEHIELFTLARPQGHPSYYLQASPELFMKRLLAAGMGAIYQIGPVFRGGEEGALHNPEFTMLEWYRPGWDYRQLIAEVYALLSYLKPGLAQLKELAYAQTFAQCLELDIGRSSAESLRAWVCAQGENAPDLATKMEWLDYIFSQYVQACLPACCVVFDYPILQPSLARVSARDPDVVERFEFFVNGVELCNGFSELTDAAEQRVRFAAEAALRSRAGRESPPLDERFIAALESGIPECAGVAMGVERLLLFVLEVDSIANVMAFDWSNI